MLMIRSVGENQCGVIGRTTPQGRENYLDAGLGIAPDTARVGAFAEPIQAPHPIVGRQTGKGRQGGQGIPVARIDGE